MVYFKEEVYIILQMVKDDSFLFSHKLQGSALNFYYYFDDFLKGRNFLIFDTKKRIILELEPSLLTFSKKEHKEAVTPALLHGSINILVCEQRKAHIRMA